MEARSLLFTKIGAGASSEYTQFCLVGGFIQPPKVRTRIKSH